MLILPFQPPMNPKVLHEKLRHADDHLKCDRRGFFYKMSFGFTEYIVEEMNHANEESHPGRCMGMNFSGGIREVVREASDRNGTDLSGK